MSIELLAFGVPGTTELCIIFGIAALIFGPKQIPKLARSVGEVIGEIKKISS